MELPLTLCDHDGNQHKGQKSFKTTTLESKTSIKTLLTLYSPPTCQQLNWQPQCITLEGLFLINTQPPMDCTNPLVMLPSFYYTGTLSLSWPEEKKYILCLIFHAGIIANTPKFFEHNCDKITSNTKLPDGNFHKTLLNCRNCKRGLVVFLGAYF